MVALSSLVRILRECLTIYSPPALFFFFFEGQISSCTLIPLFTTGSVRSGSASWDDCGRMFPVKLHVSSFPDRFPCYARTAAQSAHSNFIGSRVYAFFGCNLPPALLVKWPGSFTCHCSNTGVERTLNRRQHTKLTLAVSYTHLTLPTRRTV